MKLDNIQKKIGLVLAVAAMLTVLGGYWAKYGPPSRNDLTKLELRQAEMGIEIYSNRLRELQRAEISMIEKLDQQRRLPEEQKNKDLIRMLQESIVEIQTEKASAGGKRDLFEQRALELKDER